MGRKSKRQLEDEQLELFKLKFTDDEIVSPYKKLSEIPSETWRTILIKYPELYPFCKNKIKKFHLVEALKVNPLIADYVPSLRLHYNEVINILSDNMYLMIDDELFKKWEGYSIQKSIPYYSVSYLVRNKFSFLDIIWQRYSQDILNNFDKMYYKTKFMLYVGGKIPHSKIQKREWKNILTLGNRWFSDPTFDNQLINYISSKVLTEGETEVTSCLNMLLQMNYQKAPTIIFGSHLTQYTFYQTIMDTIEETFDDDYLLSVVDINKLGTFGIEYVASKRVITKVDFSKIKSSRVKLKLIQKICSLSSYTAYNTDILNNVKWETIKGKTWVYEVLYALNEAGNASFAHAILDEMDPKYVTSEMYLQFGVR